MDLLTPLARARMQQRDISAATLDALLEFGRVRHAGGGREIVFFDKKARARLSAPASCLARKPVVLAEATRSSSPTGR